LVELWPKIHKHCPEIKFQLVQFDNTPENAKEILKHLGQNIDIVAGVFDPEFLRDRECAALQLSMEPICCGVSIHNPLAAKERLSIEDLYGKNLMLMKRGWNGYVDVLREDILRHHAKINVVDFSFYSVEVFNQCENSDNMLMTIPSWANVHPLLKVIPVAWDHQIPFGLLHAPGPSETVKLLLDTVQEVMAELTDHEI